MELTRVVSMMKLSILVETMQVESKLGALSRQDSPMLLSMGGKKGEALEKLSVEQKLFMWSKSGKNPGITFIFADKLFQLPFAL